MQKLPVILSSFFLFVSLAGFAQADGNTNELNIVPKPMYAMAGEGHFQLDRQTQIRLDTDQDELMLIGELLAQGIADRTGIEPAIGDDPSGRANNQIMLRLEADTLGDEGYRLRVDEQGIIATASKPNGLFYAVQSILQLLPVADDEVVQVAALEVVDKPRFGWRGLMLDVGRYFYSVDYVKKFIDYLSMHKLNVFHWHLIEDHGWRIEIKKYPRLTEVGAWRRSTNFQRGDYVNPLPHGGYYTQDDIREVVAYAQSKYVTVVPEIELPGHVLSALVAYPELSCTGGPFEMPAHWGIQHDVYCAGNDQVFDFLEDVLSEVIELFPSEVIHIGGDEVPKDRWQACPKCQKRIAEEGLKDEDELQSYFIARVEKFLNSRGRHIIGWDEILEGGLAKSASVMSWRGTEGGIAAARLGHNVVMTPNHYLYLDYFQGEPYLEPASIWGFVPLRKVYGYEPYAEELTPHEHRFIVGVQGNVWSEYIHSPDKVDYMTYPRAAALAEVAWSPFGSKDFEDFKRRMEAQYERYELAGINYSKSAYQVRFDVADHPEEGTSTVVLLTDSHQPEIYYTLDGKEPSLESVLYTGPIEVDTYQTIRAATFKNGERMSPVSIRSIVHF